MQLHLRICMAEAIHSQRFAPSFLHVLSLSLSSDGYIWIECSFMQMQKNRERAHFCQQASNPFSLLCVCACCLLHKQKKLVCLFSLLKEEKDALLSLFPGEERGFCRRNFFSFSLAMVRDKINKMAGPVGMRWRLFIRVRKAYIVKGVAKTDGEKWIFI